jgi:hypothetical protein
MTLPNEKSYLLYVGVGRGRERLFTVHGEIISSDAVSRRVYVCLTEGK